MKAEPDKAAESYQKGREAMDAGHREAALEHFGVCLARLRHLSDKVSQGRVWALCGQLHLNAGAHADALAAFELSASCLDGDGVERERALMLFQLAHAARALGRDTRAVEAYDEVLRLAHDLGDGRLEGISRALRGQITFLRGGQRAGLEQMLSGLVRLQNLRVPESESLVKLVRDFGAKAPRALFEALVKDLCETRELRSLLLDAAA
jgi:tetratricopeptide (TPR) repeat protein